MEKKLQAAEKPESVSECHENGQEVIEILHLALSGPGSPR